MGCDGVLSCVATHGFVDLTELLELGAQGLVISMPCQAAMGRCQWKCDDWNGEGEEEQEEDAYPMNSLDIVVCLVAKGKDRIDLSSHCR